MPFQRRERSISSNLKFIHETIRKFTFTLIYSLNSKHWFRIKTRKWNAQIREKASRRLRMKKDSSENFPMHWNDWRIAWQFHDLTPLKSKANHTEHQTAHIFTRLMANGNLFSSHDLLVFLLSLQSKRAHNQSEKKIAMWDSNPGIVYTKVRFRSYAVFLCCARLPKLIASIKVHSSSRAAD